MALHPTRKQSNFHISLKKCILDNAVIDGIFVSFKALADIPYNSVSKETYKQWVIVEEGPKNGKSLCEQDIYLHLFTMEDPEYDKLAELEDMVIDWFSNDDGELIGFPLYNTYLNPFDLIGGVKIYQQTSTDISEFQGGVNFKTLPFLCKWAAV